MTVLGICGFYRRFVPNFAVVAEPLTYLLEIDVKFAWTEICECAFAGMKAIFGFLSFFLPGKGCYVKCFLKTGVIVKLKEIRSYSNVN